MRIGRTLPPAAAPLGWQDLGHAVAGMAWPQRALAAREDEMRRYFGVRHVFLVSSGKAALTITLMALKAGSARTEVVIPAYTCFSVAAAVLKAGLRPRLCDIDPSTFDFDDRLLEQALSRKTLCVVGHHLFGIPSDVDRLRRLCHARGIAVVEDAAQAMGVESNGRALGTIGDVGLFSLGRGKNITCGGGGVIVTRSDRIADSIRKECAVLEHPSFTSTVKDLVQTAAMAIFIRPRLYWIPASLPFLRLGETIFPDSIPLLRLSGMKAGLLRNWRTRLAQANSDRSRTASELSARLALQPPSGTSHPYLRLPFMAPTKRQKDRLLELSKAHGLGLSVAYPTPISDVPQVRAVIDGARFPGAAYVASHAVTIPTHHWLSERDKRAIVDAVAAVTNEIRPSAEWPKAS
jgi:perosamine synthetase